MIILEQKKNNFEHNIIIYNSQITIIFSVILFENKFFYY